MFFRIVLFQQDFPLCRYLAALRRDEQIYGLSRLVDTERRLSQMKIQGKISL